MTKPELNYKKSLFVTYDASAITLQAIDIQARSMRLLTDIINFKDRSEVFFAFKYRAKDSIEWLETPKQLVTTFGLFEYELTGLEQSTTYEYFVVMYDTSDNTLLEEGELLESTTLVIAEVSILPAIDVSSRKSNLRAEITELNVTEIDVNFQYKKVAEEIWSETTIQVVTTTDIVSQLIEGLDSIEDYEYRLKLNSEGYVFFTNTSSFTTLIIGEVNTFTANNIQAFNSNLRGEIAVLNTNEVDAFFLYREIGELDWIETPRQTINVASLVQLEITNLNPLSNYEFLFKIEELGDEVEGSIQTFETTQMFDFTILPAIGIGPLSADLRVQIDTLYTIDFTLEFQYRKSNSSSIKTSESQIVDDEIVYNKNVTWLTSEQSYDVRIVATKGDYIFISDWDENNFTTTQLVAESMIIIPPGDTLVTEAFSYNIIYEYFTIIIPDLTEDDLLYISGDGKKTWQQTNVNVRTLFNSIDNNGVYLKITSTNGVILRNIRNTNGELVTTAISVRLE